MNCSQSPVFGGMAGPDTGTGYRGTLPRTALQRKLLPKLWRHSLKGRPRPLSRAVFPPLTKTCSARPALSDSNKHSLTNRYQHRNADVDSPQLKGNRWRHLHSRLRDWSSRPPPTLSKHQSSPTIGVQCARVQNAGYTLPMAPCTQPSCIL